MNATVNETEYSECVIATECVEEEEEDEEEEGKQGRYPSLVFYYRR